MKRLLIASLLALGLVAGSQNQARANGGIGIGIGIGIGFSCKSWGNCCDQGYCPYPQMPCYPPMGMPFWGGAPFIGMPSGGESLLLPPQDHAPLLLPKAVEEKKLEPKSK